MDGCNEESINTIGYTLIEQLDDNEKHFWEKQSNEDRINMGIMTHLEADSLIKDTLKSLPPSFQVVFCNSKCIDCGVVSDQRLFPLACHIKNEGVHPLTAVPVHRGSAPRIHTVSSVATRHTGGVAYRRGTTGRNSRVTGRK